MFSIYKEHKGFGKQIFLLAKNELIKDYKGAVIGPLWSVVKPLFTLFVYWFAFEIGLRNSGDVDIQIAGEWGTVTRFIFMLTGFVPWFFISDSIIFGSKSIRSNRQFVTKVSFPVSTIPTFVLLSKLFVHFLLVAVMYVILIASGYGPSIYNIQFFYYCALMYLFFLALAWTTATMCAFSMDLQSMITSVISGMFWLSGIIYNTYTLDNDLLRRIMLFNPINYFVNGYRNAFIAERWFFEYPNESIVFFIEFAIVIFLGVFNYKRLRKRMADVL